VLNIHYPLGPKLTVDRNLTPGGYIELAEICFPVRTDDQTLPTDSALERWSYLILEAGEKIGRPTNNAASYKVQLQDAGFVNVVEVRHKWPQNQWPKNPKYKELGKFDFFFFPCLFFNLMNARLGLTVECE